MKLITELRAILLEQPDDEGGGEGEDSGVADAGKQKNAAKPFGRYGDEGAGITEPEKGESGNDPQPKVAKRMLNRNGIGVVQKAARSAASILADSFDQLGIEDSDATQNRVESELVEFIANLIVSI